MMIFFNEHPSHVILPRTGSSYLHSKECAFRLHSFPCPDENDDKHLRSRCFRNDVHNCHVVADFNFEIEIFKHIDPASRRVTEHDISNRNGLVRFESSTTPTPARMVGGPSRSSKMHVPPSTPRIMNVYESIIQTRCYRAKHRLTKSDLSERVSKRSWAIACS